MEPKYGIGDRVRVVNYGSMYWGYNKKIGYYTADMRSGLVGQEGIIDGVNIVQGIPNYAIDGIPGKHAWYDEGQLEMVNKNPNR